MSKAVRVILVWCCAITASVGVLISWPMEEVTAQTCDPPSCECDELVDWQCDLGIIKCNLCAQTTWPGSATCVVGNRRAYAGVTIPKCKNVAVEEAFSGIICNQVGTPTCYTDTACGTIATIANADCDVLVAPPCVPFLIPTLFNCDACGQVGTPIPTTKPQGECQSWGGCA